MEDKIQEWRNSLNRLRTKLPIDPYKLEEECRNQAVLYDEAGQLASEARSEVRRIKDKLDLKESELSSKIRSNPEDFGVEKITEGAVSATIILQEEYQDLKQEFIKFSTIADALSILQTALEQRKSMIKDLVSLFVHEYYLSQNLSNEEEFLNRGRNVEKEEE